MPLISVNDVQIKGLTVEVKSLVVGRKQLTLSLMRQFIEEPIIDEEAMLLRGVPWGFINYFWGDDKDKTPENFIHLIWQKGDELRRCVLEKKYPSYKKEQEYRSSGQAINTWMTRIKEEQAKIRELEIRINKINSNPEDWHYYNKEDLIHDKEQAKEKIIEFEKDVREWAESREQIEYFFKYLLSKYQQLITSMKDLPHFFIAV